MFYFLQSIYYSFQIVTLPTYIYVVNRYYIYDSTNFV